MNIYKNLSEFIGRTPLLEICGYNKLYAPNGVILAKLDGMNPAGSAKDRVALYMIDDAEKSGELKSGGTIIEPTSGNTGIGLAAVAVSRGYKVILTMPETMSVERRNLLKAYGAEIVLTDGAKGMAGSIEKANELQKEIPNSLIMGQFENPANAQAHYETTGPEIWNDTDGGIDIFVAGIGTGGTITGTGRFLKEKNPDVKIVAVEPSDSPLLSEGRAGAHPLQGIGANFIPKVLDTNIYDEIITVSGDDAYEACRRLAETEGFLAGISSGASLWAATQLAERPENKGKKIVAFLTDTGERYLSTGVFDRK